MALQWWNAGFVRVGSPGNVYRDVNWEACEKAMKSLNLVRWHWVAKHVSGHAGVGAKMVEWKMREIEECPRCGEVEDTRHVWTCQAPEARILRSQHFYKLRQWMHTSDTDPDVQKALSTRLTSWSLGMPYAVISTVRRRGSSSSWGSRCNWVDEYGGGLCCSGSGRKFRIGTTRLLGVGSRDDDGRWRLFKRCGMWRGICGSNEMESCTRRRMKWSYIIWMQWMRRFGINFSRVRKDCRKEYGISLRGGSTTFSRPPFIQGRHGYGQWKALEIWR